MIIGNFTKGLGIPMNHRYNAPVAIRPCENYETDEIYSVLRRCFEDAGIESDLIKGKNVVLKANLVIAKKPEFAATTHPAVVKACSRILSEMGAAMITLADSPGGPFTASAINSVYKTAGMSELEGIYGISLNDDFTFKPVHFKEGTTLKSFNVINAVLEADVLINLCKLKTHTLTGFSCAVKNVFGVIPGVEKFQMHATFPTVDAFSEMLNDLNAYLLSEKTYLTVCDGIIGMEGNGPTHGSPKKAGVLLVSASPFSLDIAAEHVIGIDGETKMLDIASARGYCPREFKDISVAGAENIPVVPFRRPDNKKTFLKNLPNFMGGRFAGIFEAKPEIIKKKCIGCGVCVRSCPKHTITVSKKKNIAVINHSDCIKCYCCQELCPLGAVKTKQNPFIKLIH